MPAAVPLSATLSGPNYPKGKARQRLKAVKKAHGVGQRVILERALEIGLEAIEANPTLLIQNQSTTPGK